ncbi:MAG: TIGR03619 family F420-dependent LLM class oxidoreductase [Chromatiales bacterium]|jgi:probable F420-dependent oxidoreductase|nr:TIGR03619 family F420-dependent LLM class oxidoreductase [Chromatiales bacterium]
MRISTNLRNWGKGSDRATITACAQMAEQGGISNLWVNERLSTPAGRGWAADDGGRYLDPLLTLTFLAAVTDRIGLGTGVINIPYRLPFQTAKQVATLQELSNNRLIFGVGVGWYETEFEVIGVPFRDRGKITDQALDLLHRSFSEDEVTINGIDFSMLPRPPRPPIYVGGSSAAALRRTIKFGDGWIPAGKMPEELAGPVAQLAALAGQAGKPKPEIIAMKTLPLDDPGAALDLVEAYRAQGVAEVVHTGGYEDAEVFRRRVDILCSKIIPHLAPSSD